jgi:hypothetical protein
LVALYQKSLKETNPAEEKRYETHFNLVSEDKEVGCSREAPIKRNNTTTKDLPSTDNMLINFESGDIFGDLGSIGPDLTICVVIIIVAIL